MQTQITSQKQFRRMGNSFAHAVKSAPHKPHGQGTCPSYILMAFAVLLTGLMPVAASAVMQSKLWEPVTWSFENPSHSGNPFDLLAKATFTHKPTGQRIRTEFFYGSGDTWKLRFTGTHVGRWSFVTESSDPELNDLDGQIEVLG